MKLYDFQETGVQWLIARKRAMLLDDMGLGKGVQVAVAVKRLGVRSMLAIVPTVVAWNWAAELRRWAGVEAQVVTEATDCLTAPFVVLTHGLLVWKPAKGKRPPVFDAVLQRRWGLVALDEAHKFCNPEAQRTRAFYGSGGVIHRAARVWLLTGTLMPNNALELWPHLRGLWPDVCSMSYEAFRDTFCETEWDYHRDRLKVVGNKRDQVGRLRAMLKGLFLRRLKTDHLDLPPIRFDTLVLSPPAMPGEFNQIAVRAKDVTIENVDQFLAWARENKEFARYRKLCGLAKVAPTVELLTGELEHGGHKVVVFAHHLDLLDGVLEGLRQFNPVLFTGGVSAAKREANKQRFQTDPKCRVAVCQIDAAGVGITLTAATEAVFVEQSFVPGANAQAADRIYRIGQTLPVRVRFLALAGTVDELVTDILRRKQFAISQVFSDEKACGSTEQV